MLQRGNISSVELLLRIPVQNQLVIEPNDTLLTQGLPTGRRNYEAEPSTVVCAMYNKYKLDKDL